MFGFLPKCWRTGQNCIRVEWGNDWESQETDLDKAQDICSVNLLCGVDLEISGFQDDDFRVIVGPIIVVG